MPLAGRAWISISPDFSGFNAKVAEHLKTSGPDVQHVRVEADQQSLKRTEDQIKGHTSRVSGILKGAAVGIGAFGVVEFAKQATESVNNLFESAQKLHAITGISRSEALQWSAVTQAMGINARQVQVAFKTLDTQYTQAEQGSKKARGAFRDLGITQKDLAATGGDSAKIFALVNSHLEKMPPSAKKTADEFKLLGRGTAALNPILADGGKEFERLQKFAGSLGITLNENTTKNIEQARDAQFKFKIAMEAAQLFVVNKLIPAFIDIGKWLKKDVIPQVKEVAGDVEKFVKQHPDLVKTAAAFTAIAIAAGKIKDSAAGKGITGMLKLLTGGGGAMGGGGIIGTVKNVLSVEKPIPVIVMNPGAAGIPGGGTAAGAGGGVLSRALPAAGALAASALVAGRLTGQVLNTGAPTTAFGASGTGHSGSGLSSSLPGVLGRGENAALGALGLGGAEQLNIKQTGGFANYTADRIRALRKELRALPGDAKVFVNGMSSTRKEVLRTADAVLQQRNVWSRSFNAAWQSVNTFYRNTKRTLPALRDDFGTNMRQIASTVGLNSDAGRKLMAANLSKMVSAIKTQMLRGKIDTGKGMDAIKDEIASGVKSHQITWKHGLDIELSTVNDLYKKHKMTTSQYMGDLRTIQADANQRIKADTTKSLRDTQADLKRQYDKGLITKQQYDGKMHAAQDAANAKQKTDMAVFASHVLDAMAAAGTASAAGTKAIIDPLNTALKALGAKPVSLTGIAVAGVAASISGAVKGVSGSLFRAQGGLVQFGRPGEAGRDSIPLSVGGTDIMVGRGEVAAVFNRHQKAELDARLARDGGLGGWFEKRKKPNYMAGGGIVGASEFGGPGDPGTGSTGYRGDNLYAHPDSYAELGMGTLLGNLPYMAPLDITFRGKTAHAFKRDIGGGGNAVAGRVRAIDLWFQLAQALGFAGTDLVTINGGAGVNVNIAGGSGGATAWTALKVPGVTGGAVPGDIVRASLRKLTGEANKYGAAHAPVSVAATGGGGPGPTTLPAGASQQQVQAAMMAAAQHILGRPYIWGGGHGAWESPGYDCSGAVSYILHAAGLLGSPQTTDTMPSAPGISAGPGKFITIGDSIARGHMMMSFFGKFFESGGAGGGGGPHWDSGWDGNFEVPLHPTGFGAGGLVGDFGEMDPLELLRGNPQLRGDPRFAKYRAAKGMQNGGLVGADAAKAKPKWWQNVTSIFDRIGHVTRDRKHKMRKPDLSQLAKLEKTVRTLGLPSMVGAENAVTRDIALADAAGGLIDGDKIARALAADQAWQNPSLYPAGWDSSTMDLPPAVQAMQARIIESLLPRVQGKNQRGWLGQELGDEAVWRNKLIALNSKITTEIARRTQVLDAAKKRVEILKRQIRATTAYIANIDKKLHPPKGHKGPSKSERAALVKERGTQSDRLRAWTAEYNGLAGENGLISVTSNALTTLHEAQGSTFGGDGALGALYGLQGPQDKARGFAHRTAAGLVGDGPSVWLGDIGQTLSSIAGYDKQYFSEPTFPSTDTSTDTTGDQLQLQLDAWAHMREAIGGFQSSVMRDYANALPYGGSFAGGGTVPGPPGAPVLITAHGGEVVTDGAGGRPIVNVILNGKGTPLEDLIDARVEHVTRHQARPSERLLPGARGMGR